MRTSCITFVFALLLSACASEPPGSRTADCAPTETRCGDVCVDLLFAPSHCGACDVRCAAGEVCSAGSCESACAGGLTDCGGSCVDTDADDDNCGACGSACGPDEACVAGACACTDGLVACGDGCTDLAADTENCGACGTACGDLEACVDGACVADCPTGTTLCGGACVNTATDEDHCGGCGLACTGGAECADGACACPAGFIECDGTCVDPESDAANCGGCGMACTAGANADAASCEAGVCTITCAAGFGDCDGDLANGCELALDDDPANCGGCDTACGASEYCEAGICCGSNDLVCEGACIDPLVTDAHCGACGLGCSGWPASSGGSCIDGACALACHGNYADCNGIRDDGCEVDMTSDRMNCGGCGNACVSLCGGEGECLTMTPPALIFGHTCMLFSDGSIHCWGLNDYGQVGDGTTVSTSMGGRTTPHRVPVPAAEELATGPYHSCSRTTAGEVTCWGRNEWGQLGAGHATTTLLPQTVLAGGVPLQGVQELALTDSSTCALLASGRVQCWGNGADGRLGSGDVADSLEPLYVSDGVAPLENVAEIAAGTNHICARLVDRSVRCWGKNDYGQLGLGDGAPAEVHVATAVPGLAGVDQIVAAGFRSCARIGGTAKCWGQNAQAQVGNGTTGANVTSPADVLGVSTAVQLHVGTNHGFALLAGGGAMGWGMNWSGQLATGTAGFISTPAPVLDPAGTAPWTGLQAIVAGGQSYSCAIDSTGQLLCWGLNMYGQLGTGGTTAETRPVPVQW